MEESILTNENFIKTKGRTVLRKNVLFNNSNPKWETHNTM